MSSPRLPVALLLAVAALDLLRTRVPPSLVVDGVTDEAAHVSTALLVLLALAGPRGLDRHRTGVASALVMSVAIDLDHLPLYAGVPGAAEGGRPATHSLLTVAVLLTAALLLVRLRPLLAGAAAGVALHLLRDVATGPGAPLAWPVTTAHLLVPYPAYAAGMAVVTAAALLRCGRQLAAAR